MNTQGQIDALLGLVQTRLDAMDPKRKAYTADTAPKAGGDFIRLSLTRRYAGNPRQGGLTPSGWRVTLRSVGVGEDNAIVLLDAGTEGLEQHTITVDGVTSTPLRFETEDPVREDDEDNALYTGLRAFTYAF